MKIEKFGVVKEGTDGKLVLDGFHIDCEGEEMNLPLLIEMIIDRLKSEIAGRTEETL